MKKLEKLMKCGREGSSLVITVVMLAATCVVLGSVLVSSMSYGRMVKSNRSLDRAVFLADAGVRMALVKLNAGDDAEISFEESQAYFTDQESFGDADWGFSTELEIRSGTNVIVSTGYYQEKRQEVECAATLGSGSRSIHALYSHALFAGNGSGTNYTLEVGGTGSDADFVNGDVYSGGNISLSGDSVLRLPEIINEVLYDEICDTTTETWQDAYAVDCFSNGLTKTEFDTYYASVSSYSDNFYNNGTYDAGEPFVDSIGNGIFDENDWFNDANGNGVRDSGDGYIDNNDNGFYDDGDTIIDNGNGEYDDGEEWVEDSSHSQRVNGKYDPAGGYWYDNDGTWEWKTTYTKKKKTISCSNWEAESFEDLGDETFDPGEEWVDANGIYDEGEEYLDDRNGTYDYGTQAYGTISGMPSPGPGQKIADGGDSLISPPDLSSMYYSLSKDGAEPYGALSRWGHDVAVTEVDYGGNCAIVDSSKPEHIFLRNPSTSSTKYVSGKTIKARSYSYVYDKDGERVDDYFLEDPTDSTYNSKDSSASIDGTTYTSPMYVNVTDDGNGLLYYVDGNLYIHSPTAYCMRFRNAGTRITIVAKGNITISDEFYYNADYDDDLSSSDIDSTIVDNPSDALCLIALKNSNCEDSGNIYIGDAQFGTGGSIHAMLYAENNFIDNNLNTSGQPYISIFGNMTAGNMVKLNRTSTGSSSRTRLDITLDERIRDGEIIVPGMPHPVGGQRSIQLDTEWTTMPGTWKSWSSLALELGVL
jgi:hypothetical protein